MSEKISIVCVVGPTASGKSARAVEIAKERNGEIISVDSRQVYRTLDIGTEKTSSEEMGGIPHYLIDVCDPQNVYSAGDFVRDARALITDMVGRGITPILAGGTHFYFDALLYGLPGVEPDAEYRKTLEGKTTEELFSLLKEVDPKRAEKIDAENPRRLIRALEINALYGTVPSRDSKDSAYDVEWVVVDHPKEVLQERINARLLQAFDRGLISEVKSVRQAVGDERLHELGLEYRIIGEYLRGERDESSLLPTLSSKLWQLARSQKKWLKRLI
jgi:tRNA dimethylallyltransferase